MKLENRNIFLLQHLVLIAFYQAHHPPDLIFIGIRG